MPIRINAQKVAKIARVKVAVSNTGQVISNKPVTVQGLPPATRLDSLLDVDPSGEIAGGVPVYNPVTDKYDVKLLDFNDIDPTGGIDGGEF